MSGTIEKKIVQSKNKKASMPPFFVCSLSNCLAYLKYIVVMSPSRAEGFSARLVTFFTSARN